MRAKACPAKTFIQADAARFSVDIPADAAVCLFDSLNHLLEAEQLASAFRCVQAALRPRGLFLFDINTGEAYGENWNDSACHVEPDHAFFLRGGFNPKTRIGCTAVTMFHAGADAPDSWRRSDIEVHQRPWEITEVEPLLRTAGFDDVRLYRAIDDLGLTGDYGWGRVFVSARRSP